MTERDVMKTLSFDHQSILIADPCYVMGDSRPEDSEYGRDMTRIGYTKCHTERNGYGDGSWEVVNKDGSTLGVIWVDSGQVGVFLYDEVQEHTRGHALPAGTVILDGFTGEVSFSFREKTLKGLPWPEERLVLRVCGRTSNGSGVDFTIYY